MMKKLYLVWYDPGTLNKIGVLIKNNNNYTFEYINYETNDLQIFSKNGLFPGFFDINKKYISDTLFPNVINRLPSLSRVDYYELLKRHNVQNKDDEFEILEKTKGRMSSDGFLFIREEELHKLEMEQQSAN